MDLSLLDGVDDGLGHWDKDGLEDGVKDGLLNDLDLLSWDLLGDGLWDLFDDDLLDVVVDDLVNSGDDGSWDLSVDGLLNLVNDGSLNLLEDGLGDLVDDLSGLGLKSGSCDEILLKGVGWGGKGVSTESEAGSEGEARSEGGSESEGFAVGFLGTVVGWSGGLGGSDEEGSSENFHCEVVIC